MQEQAVFAVRNGSSSHVLLPRGGDHDLPACRPGHVYLSFPFADESTLSPHPRDGASALPDPEEIVHLGNGHGDLYHHARRVHEAMRPHLGERVADQAALRVVDCDHPNGIKVKRVHPSSALLATDVHLVMGAPSLIRKRFGLNFGGGVPGDDPSPFVWSSTADLEMPADTVGGFGIQCANCSVRYQPLFELRVRMTVGFGGMSLDRLRVSVGSDVATADVMRYTLQGVANFVSYRIPLASHEFFTFRTLIAGFVPLWVTPAVQFRLSTGTMIIGAVEFISGSHARSVSNYGFEYTKNGGMKSFSSDVEYPVRQESEFIAWPARTNPRFKLHASVGNVAAITFWSVISPYAVLRSPQLGFEYSLRAPFCEGGPGYNIDLSLSAFCGLSIFPGLERNKKLGKFVFLEFEFAGGFPGGLFSDLPHRTLAKGCFDAEVGDDETDPILPHFEQDEVDLGSLLPGIAQDNTEVAYTQGDSRGARLEAAEAQLVVELLPQAASPDDVTVMVRATSTDSEEAELKLPQTQDLVPYVRFCLPLGTAVPAAWQESPEDLAAAGIFGELFPCDGTSTAFRTGKAAGVVVGDTLMSGEEGEFGPIVDEIGLALAWSPSRAFGLPARPTSVQFFVAEASSTIAPGLSAWLPVTASGASDVGGTADVSTLPPGEAVLYGVWTQCNSLCLQQERTRTAFCTSISGDGSVEVCGAPWETANCRLFACPRHPILFVDDSPFSTRNQGAAAGSLTERAVLTTPDVIDLRFVGGAPTDTFAVDVLVGGCADAGEDDNLWLSFYDVAIRNPGAVAEDLGVPGEEEPVLADATPTWSVQIAVPPVLGFSTAFRVRPIHPESGCTYWDHAVVTNEVVLTSRRRHALALFDAAGEPIDIRPALAASPASRLVLVGDATSIFLGGDNARSFTEATYSSGVLSWYDVDPGAFRYLALTHAGTFFEALGDVGPLQGVSVTVDASDITVENPLPTVSPRASALGDGPEVRARFSLDGTGHRGGDATVYWQCELTSDAYGGSGCTQFTGTVAGEKVPPFVTAVDDSITSMSCTWNRLRLADPDAALSSLGRPAPYRADEQAAGADTALGVSGSGPVCTVGDGPGSFRAGDEKEGTSSGSLSTAAIIGIAAGAGCCCLLLLAALSTAACMTLRASRGRRDRASSLAPAPKSPQLYNVGGGGGYPNNVGAGGYPNAPGGAYQAPAYAAVY
jgi:hypothetical protein